jgi:hypothetical protein
MLGGEPGHSFRKLLSPCLVSNYVNVNHKQQNYCITCYCVWTWIPVLHFNVKDSWRSLINTAINLRTIGGSCKVSAICLDIKLWNMICGYILFLGTSCLCLLCWRWSHQVPATCWCLRTGLYCCNLQASEFLRLWLFWCCKFKLWGGGGGRIAVPIHDFGVRWRLAVIATLWPRYLQEWVPVPTVQEFGWVSGLVWTGTDYLFLTGVQTPYRPDGRSLYADRTIPSTFNFCRGMKILDQLYDC